MAWSIRLANSYSRWLVTSPPSVRPVSEHPTSLTLIPAPGGTSSRTGYLRSPDTGLSPGCSQSAMAPNSMSALVTGSE